MRKNKFQDELTSKERVQAFLDGKPYDRIPGNPFIGEQAARIIGIKISEYHLSAEKLAEAQIAAYRTYGHDGLQAGPVLQGIAEAIGSKVEFPEESTPYIADAIIKDFSDLDNLEPPNPRTAGRFPLFLESFRRIIEEVGDEVGVSVVFPGPFTTAAYLRGPEVFLRDLYYHPEFAHKLLRFATDSTIPFVLEAAKLGVGFSACDPTASGTLINHKAFQTFALPYLKEVSTAIKAAVDTKPSLHICGNSKKIWQFMADAGFDMLSLDNQIDLAEAKQAVGDRVILVGNVSPTAVMELGTPADVEKGVKESLRKAFDAPKGYFLALGCGLPIETPLENIQAFMDAARKYGRYPLKPELFADETEVIPA